MPITLGPQIRFTFFPEKKRNNSNSSARIFTGKFSAAIAHIWRLACVGPWDAICLFCPLPSFQHVPGRQRKKQRNRNEMSGAVSEIESSRKKKETKVSREKKDPTEEKKSVRLCPRLKGCRRETIFFPFPFLNFSSFFSGKLLGRRINV